MRFSTILASVCLAAGVTSATNPWSAPHASINWDGLRHIRVYGQDPDGNIVEWQWDNGASWTGPSRLPFLAKYGTPMTAENDGSRVN